MDDYKRHIETWNQFGEICKDAGIQFSYHNHDFEFQKFAGESEFPYELIMRETDHDNVKFEMDLFWVSIAGQDPVEWFKKEKFHVYTLMLHTHAEEKRVRVRQMWARAGWDRMNST